MPSKNPSTTVKFVFERETKGTKRFQEVPPENEEPIIGTIYVRKFALNALGNPDSFTVTITPEA